MILETFLFTLYLSCRHPAFPWSPLPTLHLPLKSSQHWIFKALLRPLFFFLYNFLVFKISYLLKISKCKLLDLSLSWDFLVLRHLKLNRIKSRIYVPFSFKLLCDCHTFISDYRMVFTLFLTPNSSLLSK